MDINNFQRIGAPSNTHVGEDFEELARLFFARTGISLIRSFPILIGVGAEKKLRRFDLGSENPAILVECKSHTWTQGGNMPSAKLTVWNEAMFYFHIAPAKYRKVLFVLKDVSVKRNTSLASYYIKSYGHLIPSNIEIWEYDSVLGDASRAT